MSSNSSKNNGMSSSGCSRNSSSSNYNLAQDSSELFDIYPSPPSTQQYNSIISSDWGESFFPSPLPTGEVKERGQVHKDGDWHRSVQVWVVQKDMKSENVRVLLQRRSPYKDTHPNQLDVSCAGHVNSGDNPLETTMRELEEELGGNGFTQQYSKEDVQRLYTVTSSIEGETVKYGKYVCREYQEVYILWYEGDGIMETNMFAPLVKEEVSGFEIISGKDLIQRLREGDNEFVPRSTEYVNALAKIFGL